MSSLTAEVELLRTKLANVWMQLEEERADRDAWRFQAERLGMALPKPEAPPTRPSGGGGG